MAIDGAVANYNENAGSVYNARELRRQFDRLTMGWDVRTAGGLATTGTANGGVARHYGAATTGDFAVIQRAAGANMSVDVLLGGALVGGTESAHQGEYFAYNDASINVVISASDPTNPRIDLIVIRVRDSEYSGALNNCTVEVVTGTAAGVPAEPTVPANCVTLARVDVAAAAASILTANITDRRRSIAAIGGITPCTSSATYPTVNLWEGMAVYDRTLDAVLFYSGAAWIQIGPLSAWTTFTPTFSGGWLLGNSAVVATYMRVARKITYSLKVTLGTTATIGAGALGVALPVTAALASPMTVWAGVAVIGASFYHLWCYTSSTTVANPAAGNAGGTYLAANAVTSSVPGAWATGDILYLAGAYEAAA